MLTHSQQTKLYNYYKIPIIRFIEHKTNINYDTDIICNNVFIRVFKYIEQYSGPITLDPHFQCNVNLTFKNWIYAITRRCIVDYHRQNKQYSENIILTDDLPEYTIPYSIEVEYDSLLQTVITSLPNTEKCILMDYIEGYTYKELQVKYNIAYGTVKWYIHNARKYIKTKYNVFNWSKQYITK